MSENEIDKNELFVDFLLHANLFELKACYDVDKFHSLKNAVKFDISMLKFKNSINFFLENYHEIKATYENTPLSKKDLFETAIKFLNENDFEKFKEKLMKFVVNYPEKNKSFNDLQCEKIAKFYNALSKTSFNSILFNYSQNITKYKELTPIYFYFMLIVNKNYEDHINKVCEIIEKNSINRDTVCILLDLIPTDIKQLNHYDSKIEMGPPYPSNKKEKK